MNTVPGLLTEPVVPSEAVHLSVPDVDTGENSSARVGLLSSGSVTTARELLSVLEDALP
jgi:hypothetical protein